MKKIFRLSLTFIVIIFISGFSNRQTAYTDYYYYQQKQYHLVLVPNAVFVELSSKTDRTEFDELLAKFPGLFVKQEFNIQDKKGFLFDRNNLTNEELEDLVTSLNQKSEIVNASPVFRMPDGKGNPNTLIGVENEIIVQFKQSVNDNDINSYLNQNGMNIRQELSLSGGKSYILNIPQGAYSIDYANELYLSGLVNYSEPNLFYTNLLDDVTGSDELFYIPNDTYYPMQWSHKNTGNNIPGGVSGTPGCDMRTDSAWDYTLGDPIVIVSMVDTGIDTLHEDLNENIIHGLSIDTYNNLPYAWDDNNHGTSTAGIVAAIGNNNMGISGVAPQCRIFGVKIFNAGGNTNSSAIVNGLIAAWQRGSWISSNSWGGGSPISAADNAINDGVNYGRNGKGVVWCFATGNYDTEISWPSTNPNVISVGGISPCNQRKSTSSCDGEYWWGANYGTGLEIVAPCVKIYSTDRTGSPGYTSGNYISDFNGTSSATPNVSGVCALVLSVDSTLTWDVLRERICTTADKVGSYVYNQPGQLGLGGWNNQMGYGKINAYQVVKLTSESIPVELTSFSASVISNAVNLTWTTSTETNNKGFILERKMSGGLYENISFINGSGTTTQPHQYFYTDKNLAGGKYIYRLVQIDFDGTSEYSKEKEVSINTPSVFSLKQNYPNPFNPSTRIDFSLGADANVSLKIFNILGQEVADLLNSKLSAGFYSINFDAASANNRLISGVYFYKLDAVSTSGKSFTSVKKMIITK